MNDISIIIHNDWLFQYAACKLIMIYDECDCDDEYVVICVDDIIDLINISHFIHLYSYSYWSS